MAENAGVGGAKAKAQAKKRIALGNLTNVIGGRAGAAKGAADAKLSSTNSVADVKKGSSASLRNVNTERCSVTKPTSNQFDRAISHHDNALQKENVCCPSAPNIMPTVAPSGSSPGLSKDSVSMEDAMSTCNSIESPDLEYLDNGNSPVASSLHHSGNDKPHISDNRDVAVSNWRMQDPTPMEIDNIFDIDNNHEDPKLCATLACDIYKHLREAEVIDSSTCDSSANICILCTTSIICSVYVNCEVIPAK